MLTPKAQGPHHAADSAWHTAPLASRPGSSPRPGVGREGGSRFGSGLETCQESMTRPQCQVRGAPGKRVMCEGTRGDAERGCGRGGGAVKNGEKAERSGSGGPSEGENTRFGA